MDRIDLRYNKSHDYLYEATYANYIRTKIDNEYKLATSINEQLILVEDTDLATKSAKLKALYESKTSNKIKSGWEKFIGFIKKIFGKFMESISNILLDEKEYLEKYKDIILNKRPKDIEFSYTGNYRTGVERIVNTTVPIFDYSVHAELLKDEDNYGPFVDKVFNGKYKYDDSENLGAQFKDYFICYEDGEKTGTFDDLNFREMYNFCYDFKKVESVVKKDIDNLDKSTTEINKTIQEKLKEEPEVEAQAASFLYSNISSLSSLSEAKEGEGNKQKFKIQDATIGAKQRADEDRAAAEKAKADAENKKKEEEKNKAEKAKEGTGDTSLKVSKLAGSVDKAGYNDNKDEINKMNADAAKAANAEASQVDKIINRYSTVCQAIITAKWTACEHIAKDYMTIIREHVRSYLGEKKDDTSNNRGAKEVVPEYKQSKDSKYSNANVSSDSIIARAKAKKEKEAGQGQNTEQGQGGNK